MANSVSVLGAVCSESMLFASVLNSSVMLGNYLQQTTSADDIFRCISFLALEGLRIVIFFLNLNICCGHSKEPFQ